MRASNLLLALTLALALGGAARAQDATPGGLRPTDKPADPVAPAAPAGGVGADKPDPIAPPQAPATPDTPTVEAAPKDPGGWRGQPPAAPAPAGVPQAAPAGAPTAPAGGADPLAGGEAVKPAADPNVIQNDDPRAGKIIDRNYAAAIKTYDDVLKDGESTENLDHRISTNEKLVADYKKRLAVSNEAKRRFQVELFNRTFYLKQQKDKGAIPDDVYEKLMKQEQKKYDDKSATTRSDCDFYEKEIADAEKRLAELRAERRVTVVNNRTNFAGKGGIMGKPKPQRKPSEIQIGTLKDRLSKLSTFEPKNTMDSSPLCDECAKAQAPAAPAAPSAPADQPQAPPPGNP
jgi:hypothetical protein